MSNNNKWTGVTIGIVVALIVLTAIITMAIRIPVIATTGYFNIGGIFVILAGLLLGPLAGTLVGAIGPAIADAVGYPVFIPATFIIYGLVGFAVGIIARGSDNASFARKAVAASTGGVVMILGYFIFEAFIYPILGTFIRAFAITDMNSAIAALGPNTIQGIIGAVGGLFLWKVVSRYYPSNKTKH